MDLQWKATNTTQSGEQRVYSNEKYNNIIDLYEDVLIYWFHPAETNWFVNNIKEYQNTGIWPISRLEITSSKVSAGPLYIHFDLCVSFALDRGPNDGKALLYGLTKSVAHRLIKMRRLYIMNHCSITTEENRNLLAIAPLDIRKKIQRWLEDRRIYEDIDDNPWIIWPSLSTR